LDVTGVATAATFEPDGDTAAGDNAAIGYTAAEGLILTGQGSTSDITLKMMLMQLSSQFQQVLPTSRFPTAAKRSLVLGLT
jgi:hypothetical protein